MIAIDGPRLLPQDGPVEKLVILSHGYGSDGRDLIALGEYWQSLLPHTAFVAPNAPQRCETAAMGYQWFSLDTLNPGAHHTGVTAAAPTLDAFIDQELRRFDLQDEDLALVGFSQGTMISLHVGLARAPAVAGILGFSGMLVGTEDIEDRVKSHPPVFLIHGGADDLIPPRAAVDAAEILDSMGVPAQFHISNGIGHGVSEEGLMLGGDFLKRILHP